MAWAAVSGQHVHGNGNAVNSFTIAMPGAVTLNNRIIVETTSFNIGAVAACAVSDTLGNSYVEDAATTYTDGTAQSRASTFSAVVTTAGTPTLTISFAGGAGGAGNHGGAASAQEYSGLSTTSGSGGVDAATATTGSGGTASVTTGGSTTAANELVAGGYSDDGWNVNLSAKNGTGFTERDVNGSSTVSETYLEDKDSGSSGATQTANMASGTPGGTATWAMSAVVYKLAAAGGLPPGLGTREQMDVVGMAANQVALMR